MIEIVHILVPSSLLTLANNLYVTSQKCNHKSNNSQIFDTKKCLLNPLKWKKRVLKCFFVSDREEIIHRLKGVLKGSLAFLRKVKNKKKSELVNFL